MRPAWLRAAMAALGGVIAFGMVAGFVSFNDGSRDRHHRPWVWSVGPDVAGSRVSMAESCVFSLSAISIVIISDPPNEDECIFLRSNSRVAFVLTTLAHMCAGLNGSPYVRIVYWDRWEKAFRFLNPQMDVQEHIFSGQFSNISGYYMPDHTITSVKAVDAVGLDAQVGAQFPLAVFSCVPEGPFCSQPKQYGGYKKQTGEHRDRVCPELLPNPFVFFGIATAVVALGTYIQGRSRSRAGFWTGPMCIGFGLFGWTILALFGDWWSPLICRFW